MVTGILIACPSSLTAQTRNLNSSSLHELEWRSFIVFIWLESKCHLTPHYHYHEKTKEKVNWDSWSARGHYRFNETGILYRTVTFSLSIKVTIKVKSFLILKKWKNLLLNKSLPGIFRGSSMVVHSCYLTRSLCHFFNNNPLNKIPRKFRLRNETEFNEEWNRFYSYDRLLKPNRCFPVLLVELEWTANQRRSSRRFLTTGRSFHSHLRT